MERGRKYRQINDEMRRQIAEMYGQNYSIREIALEMKMNQSSVYREINRGLTDELDESGRFKYDLQKARRAAAISTKNKGIYMGSGIDGRKLRSGRRKKPQPENGDIAQDDIIAADSAASEGKK